MLETLLTNCPPALDLTHAEHLALIKEKVELILENLDSQEEMKTLENELTIRKDPQLISALLALKIARSKRVIQAIDQPMKVSVVFAVYKEHNRIRTKEEHPHGEDFLMQKISQLQWLFDDQDNFEWELILVDDGCPEGSGKIAQKILEKNQITREAKVLFLQDAIEAGLPVVAPMTSTRESMKGGSITYGMWHAAQQSEHDNHIVLFTDADLSTHLGQIGLLVDPIANAEKQVAIASRRETDSVVIKKGSRNSRGKLFIYLWKRFIPQLHYVIDTQCGFKAFKKEVLSQIVEDMIEKKFAFDIELLLKSELIQPNSIEKVGVGWIDSEAASTTTDLQPYLPMLKSTAKMYQKYLPQNDLSDEFAAFIEALSLEEFNQLLDNIPEAITSREPVEFTEFQGVSVADLKQALMTSVNV